jgi:hypothetical protein
MACSSARRMPVLRVAGAVLLMVEAGCGVGLALLRSAAVVVIRNVDSMDCKRICICFIWNFSVSAVSSSEESEEELEEEEEYMMQLCNCCNSLYSDFCDFQVIFYSSCHLGHLAPRP